MNKNLLVIERPSLNIDLSLYFFKFMKSEVVVKRLKNRLAGLGKIKDWMDDLEKNLPKGEHSYYLAIMAQHSSRVAEIEIEFTNRLIDIIQTKGSLSREKGENS